MAGSGAGADLTRIAESAQCVFAAARFYGSTKDLTPEMVTEKMLKDALKHCDVDDKNIISNIFKKMDAAWWVSLCLTANQLFKLFGKSKSKNYTFHRGSKFVDSFEKNFTKWNNQADRYFSNINKYTPADIWITSSKFKDFKFDKFYKNGPADTGNGCFGEVNKFLIEKYKSNDIIGVSLKKTSSAPVSYYNMPGAKKYEFRFTGYKLHSGDFFASKDVYLNYNKGKIQFRSFSSRPTSWQGEIKGAEANLGKIGGGLVTRIVQETFPQKSKEIYAVSESAVITEEVMDPKNLSPEFIDYFYFYYSLLQKSNRVSKSDMAVKLRKKEATWIYSKYLGMELLSIFEEITPKERDTLISNILLYAMSSSPDSAPFVKIG